MTTDLAHPHVYALDGVVPVIEPGAFVHPAAVLIGDVVVGSGAYVGPGASLRGDFGRILVRPGSNVQDNCTLHSYPGMDAVVGEEASIGHGAVLHSCVVGRAALVGMNAVVMDGATVGDAAVVAAMAFVRAGFTVPPRTLVAGLPAKIVRTLSDEEVAWSAAGTRSYQELVERSRTGMVACAPLSAEEAERPRVYEGDLRPLHVTKG